MIDFDPMDLQQVGGWNIRTDAEALWAIRKINEAKADTKAWESHYKNALERIRTANSNTVAFMTSKLEQYFNDQPHRTTRGGQEKYDLPDGACLTRKPAGHDYSIDMEKVLEWALDNEPEVVKASVSLDWSSLKKRLTMDKDGKVFMKQTGEVANIPGLTVIDTDPAFSATMKEEK